MARDAAAPGDEVSESTTQEKQPEPAEVDEADGETSEAGEAESEEADDDAADDDANVDTEQPAVDTDEEAPAKPRMSRARVAIIAGLVVLVALAALTGWLGFRAYKSYQADQQRKLFLQVGRQGAVNLTTIDWQRADADVQRILDSATGTFYDDFLHRSQPFIAVVKQTQSHSEGTITEAGLETESGEGAQVLVAVTVKTSTAGGTEQRPRSWRMRISVQKVGDEAKVSDVQFVP
jgi:Mce-associated membrane protein